MFKYFWSTFVAAKSTARFEEKCLFSRDYLFVQLCRNSWSKNIFTHVHKCAASCAILNNSIFVWSLAPMEIRGWQMGAPCPKMQCNMRATAFSVFDVKSKNRANQYVKRSWEIPCKMLTFFTLYFFSCEILIYFLYVSIIFEKKTTIHSKCQVTMVKGHGRAKHYRQAFQHADRSCSLSLHLFPDLC